jgi:hypothetical protein
MRYLVLLLLITSCASRKVDVSKKEIKTNTDSTAIIKTDSTSIINKNVYFTENTSELEIKPFNDSLPIVIDGKSYFNAILKYKNQNKVLVDTSKIIVSKNVLKQVSKSKQETKNIKEKHIDKKVNNFVYLWLLLIPIGMYLYRQLKNKLFL